MNLNLVFLIFLSALVSGLLSYYHYFYKKEYDRVLVLPAFFRFLGIFSLLLLLINPQYHARQTVVVKPDLLVAWDASSSVSFSGAEQQVADLVRRFHDDEALNEQFEVQFFGFGETLSLGDSLSFTSGQTDIERALNQLNQLASSKTAPIVLITDGIQTVGRNYAYTSVDQKVFPLIVGDTVKKNDIEISQVNANAFVTLGNDFEVEAFVSFSGEGQVNSELILEEQGEVLDRKPVTFSSDRRSQRIKFQVSEEEPGHHTYRVRLTPFSGEQEKLNNKRSFEVEVVDSQTEIAVIYSFPHPDLGMIKQSLESEQKKEVELIPISEWSADGENYPVHVLFQPDSRFKALFNDLQERQANYFLITGASSDWDFINDNQNAFDKNAMLLEEDAYPVFEGDFSSFYLEDIGFEDFPALNVNLGQIDFRVSHDHILKQAINGIESGDPLLTIFQEEGARRVVLFGTDLWKWRAFVYQRDQSFVRFDRFFDALIQYLYLTNRNQEIELFYERINFDDQKVRIQARKYDSNLNLDLSSPLELRLKDTEQVYPMYVNNGFYEVQLDDLNPGTYQFSINDPANEIRRAGSFEVVSYSAEQMKLTSDVSSMNYLADKTGGKAFYGSEIDQTVSHLLETPEFKPLEKIEKNRISLIDQKWLLALIVLSLSIEWFIRKYRGLV